MRSANHALSVLAILLFMAGCSKSLPDAYGIYADTNHGRTLLVGQGVRVAGNMLNPIAGLIGPSGVECRYLKDFVVYKKDINPDSVGLVMLNFVRDAQLPGIFGSTQARINLWLPKERIDVEVKPVEQKRDMYVVAPRKSLDKGFYALYIGSFGGEMGMGGQVYDVVIGSAADYPSYAAAAKSRETQLKSDASALLAKMNQLLDRKEYSHLGEVYRPEGNSLSGAALQEFVDGNQTWLGSAGRIVKSEVVSVSPSDDGQSARCSVKTTYEKAGVQEESLTIRKIGDRYFITELK